MKLVLLKAWTDSINVAAIDPASISPGTLEKLLVEAAPMLQKLVFNIIVSIIIFIVGRRLISILLKILNRFLSHVEMDEGVNKFLQSAARMLLYILLIFMIVGQLGVSTASIVTILGAGGLAISMSLQGSLSNVAGGILILLMKPFRVGDFVSTPYGDGTVRTIGRHGGGLQKLPGLPAGKGSQRSRKPARRQFRRDRRTGLGEGIRVPRLQVVCHGKCQIRV